MKIKFVLSLAILLFAGLFLNVHAQDWHNTKKDIEQAVDVDTISKKGYTLVWINKEPNFNAGLKQELIDVFFATYPKLAKTFNKKTRKEVIFVIDPDYDGVAATAGGIVRYSPKWFAKNPKDIDVVTHEVMHIVQAYEGKSGPWWVTEGIADWVRYAYGVANEAGNWRLPKLEDKHSYENGYRVTARFFHWIETKVKKKTMKKLDLAMRNHTYSSDFWKEQTGKTIDELWADYKLNPAI
ncbi:basic secretory protein-like protein [Sphingobacterium sp. HJSM2_6]|uniref:basic secretory protein-like protein n=1 Tax=Sphingobacterium sp. HJSM2_6 TaxID=3366264 RepID=UPI003BCE7A9E